MNGENSQRMQQGARERDDINYKRNQEAAYQRQNWQHKVMTFEAEQRQARIEGRYPMFASPAQVSDMPRGDEGRPAPSDWSLAPAVVIGLVFLLVASIIWTVFALLAPIVVVALRIVLLLLIAGVVGLTLTWLIMHLTAGDDPAKIHRAKLFNPIRVSKVLALFIVDWFKERKERKERKNAN